MTHITAAIDIGTNSFHLVIAAVDPNGRIEVVGREKESVRLGEGADDMKALTDVAMDRGIVTLRRMRQIAEHAGASAIVGVATSAVREAGNRAEFVRRAADEAGLEVRVISGVEEARLIHLGVLQAVPVFGVSHLVIDIGGGSTEFILGEGRQPRLLRSLKLGAIRLTERFFPKGQVRPKAIARCRNYLDSFLVPLHADIDRHGFERAVGSSGTIQTIANMASAEPSGPVRNRSVTRDDLQRVIDDIVARRTVQERLALPGLEPRRADIIVGGALLLEAIVRTLDIDRLEISDYALREGVIFEQLRRARASGPDPFHRLGDLRRNSVMDLAQRYQEDLGHAEHITDLALELFDGLEERHGLGDDERDLLEAAGLLHNLGIFINHSAHHKHSYYLIRHSEHLVGFSEREIEIIAQVARYHRKSAPKTKHPEFAELDPTDRRRVRILAGLLRVAIGLDRSNRQVISRVETALEGDQATVVAFSAPGTNTEIELFTADARRALLENALSLDVVIERRHEPGSRDAHPASRA